MCQRLDVPKDADAAEVQKRFDNELGVSGWASPGMEVKPGVEVDPDAPLWWTGDEDASQSFLASMGVRLPDS
jgi:hypothetical protein